MTPTRTSPGPSASHARQTGKVASLRDLVQAALSCAARAAVATDARARDSEERALRHALSDASRIARETSVRAEHLLLLLKGEWRCMPDAAELSWPEGEATLARVITLCIVEYYRRDFPDAGPGR